MGPMDDTNRFTAAKDYVFWRCVDVLYGLAKPSPNQRYAIETVLWLAGATLLLAGLVLIFDGPWK